MVDRLRDVIWEEWRQGVRAEVALGRPPQDFDMWNPTGPFVWNDDDDCPFVVTVYNLHTWVDLLDLTVSLQIFHANGEPVKDPRYPGGAAYENLRLIAEDKIEVKKGASKSVTIWFRPKRVGLQGNRDYIAKPMLDSAILRIHEENYTFPGVDVPFRIEPT